MSFQAMTWAVEHKLPISLKMVLIMLANRTNHDTGRCDPSHKRLAVDCGMSVSTVKRSLEKLEELGLVTTEERKEGLVNLPNQYLLHLDRVGSHRPHPVQKEPRVRSRGAEGGVTVNRGGGVTVSYKTGSSKPGIEPGIEPLPPAAPTAQAPVVIAGLEPSGGEERKFMQVEIAGRVFDVPCDLRYPLPGSDTHIEWSAYAVCYHHKHGDWPAYSGKAAGMLKNILSEIPRAEFPAVVGAFFRSGDRRIVENGYLLRDLVGKAQRFLTEAKTGRSMTATRARQIDQTQTNASVADEAIAILMAKRRARDEGVIDADE